MTSQRVLVTGAAGVVGRALTIELQEHGCTVVGLSSADGDLRVQEVAERLVRESEPDVVVHLAARVHGLMGNVAAQADVFLDNIRMNTNVVEAARVSGVRKVIAMGSTAVYSDAAPLPMSEDDIWVGPPHHSEYGYAQAKRTLIAQLQTYQQQYDLDYAVVLATNLYGPGDRFDEVHGHVLPSLVSRFHRAATQGTDVTVWGTGTPTRDFVYSTDAARAIRLIMESYTGVINLATGRSVTIREAAETLRDVSELPGRLVWDASKPDGQRRRSYDASRLTTLGWRPLVPLRDGLAATYSWYSEHHASARR